MVFKLKPYQEAMVEKIIGNKRLGLFLDMGLGKTLITLFAIKMLMLLDVKKVLVVAPKKVAESTWSSEVAKWDFLKDLKLSLILGTKKNKIDALKEEADIYVTNRDSMSFIFGDYYLKEKPPFDMIVLDESTSFKNHKAVRYRALRSKIYPDTRVVLLTGTPVPNSYMDLWAQVYLLDGGQRLEKTLTKFRDRYFNANRIGSMNVFNYTLKEGADKLINSKIDDICFSLKSEDYIDLPDIIYNDFHLKFSDKELKAYKNFEKNLVLELDSETIDATSRAALLSKLLQASNGAIYNANKEWFNFSSAKLEALQELVESLNGQNALLFYSFVSDKERILKTFEKSNLVVKALESAKDVELWNEGKINLLLAHPSSTAYGLNLQFGGSNIIWYGLTFNAELYIQANKRLHRRGQAKPVIVHHLLTDDTRDEGVLKVVQKKEDINNVFMDVLKVNGRGTNNE